MSDDHQRDRDRAEAVAYAAQPFGPRRQIGDLLELRKEFALSMQEASVAIDYLSGLRAERERGEVLREAVRALLSIVRLGDERLIGMRNTWFDNLTEEQRAALVAVLEGKG